jgi:hypothetical protein
MQKYRGMTPMTGDRDFTGPQARFRAPERRAEAEHAIEQAFAALEGGMAPSVDQLSDLADAIDSFKEGSFGVAAELAAGALRKKALPIARRPQSLARTIPDLRAAFDTTRRFLATPTFQRRD